MTFPMILITLLCLTLAASQVSHDIVDPKVVKVCIGRNIKTVPQNTGFSQNFPTLGYDIGGKVYETHKGLVDENLFDTSYYQPSTSCVLYKTDLNLKLIVDLSIEQGLTVESIVSSDQLKALFAVVSNESYSEEEDKKVVMRQLIAYDFTKTTLTKAMRKTSISALGLNSSQVLDIQLIVVSDRVIVTDGIKMVSVDAKDFSKFKSITIDMKDSKTYDYQFASQNDLIKFTLCHYSAADDYGIILATWNKILIVYELTANLTKATLSFELPPPSGTIFTDAIPDHGRYWALADGKFMAFRPNQSEYQLVIIQLQSSDCFSLNKYESTLHIICREGGLNYVAEYFFNQTFASPYEALKLNRYYTQIDDAKLLFKFGGDYNPKLIIAGDNDLQIHPYAINRQVLLESSYPPRTTQLRSLGVQLIHSIPSFSNFTHNYAIGVGARFIALFVIEENPPEMECRIMRAGAGQQLNILVQLNTSSCVANGDWEQLQSICTYYFPFNVYASLVEVDAANHKTIVATVLLLLLAVAILVVGCGFYCRTNMERAAAEIKRKIEALKKKENKPI